MKIELNEYRSPQSPYNYLDEGGASEQLLLNLSRKYVEYLQEKSTGADFVNEDPIYVVSTGMDFNCRRVSGAYVLCVWHDVHVCATHSLHGSLPVRRYKHN